MTLFVVLGLVAVVVGVLVAVALGVRSMRAEEHGDDDWDETGWDSPERDGSPANRDDAGRATRRGQRSPSPSQRRSGGAGMAPGGGYESGYQPRQPGRPAKPGASAQRDFTAAAETETMLSAAANAARAARRPAVPGETSAPSAKTGPGQPGRRRTSSPGEPDKRGRPARRRDGGSPGEWNTTNWERVSDEDYWAEMSADKPLAARTAQSAADLQPREPEARPKRPRDKRTDPNLARPEPQTATMTMPGLGDSGGTDAGRQEKDLGALPVRRSGSAPGVGQVIPAARQPGPAPADYSDPSLAASASMGDPPGRGRARHAAAAGPASASGEPAVSPGTPARGWPAAASSGGRDWQRRGRGHAATDSGPGGYYPAPASSAPSGYPATSDRYPTPSHGTSPATGYVHNTPGYGLPASPGYPAHATDGPGAPTAAGFPPASYGPLPERAGGAPGGLGDTAGSYTSRHGASPAPYAPDGHVPAGGQGGYAAHGTAADGHGRPPTAWGTPGSAASAGPAASPPEYPTPYTSGYSAAPSADPAATGGVPSADRTGHAGQPASGGFASGYLSSSALSAHGQAPDLEPLAGGAGSGNPYGSYVTGPGTSRDDGSRPGHRRSHRRDRADYDDQQRYGGRYGDYGGSHR